MKKRLVLSLTLILLGALSLSAYSRDTLVTKNSLLVVKDHAGENFLVLKVDSCSLGNNGELLCAMKPQAGAQKVQAGPAGGFFDRLAYHGS